MGLVDGNSLDPGRSYAGRHDKQLRGHEAKSGMTTFSAWRKQGRTRSTPSSDTKSSGVAVAAVKVLVTHSPGATVKGESTGTAAVATRSEGGTRHPALLQILMGTVWKA